MGLNFFSVDYSISFSLIIILGISLCIIGSLSSQDNPPFISFYKQLILLVISGIVFLFFSNIDWRIYNNRTILVLYFISLFLLLAVLLVGQKTRGATAWFRIGPFSFQPLEIMKIVLILLLAKYLASRHLEIWQFFHLFATFLYTFLPVSLLVAQPDLGGATILVLIWFAMILVSGIRAKQILFLLISGGLIICLAWLFLLQPYQRNRIISFLKPETDPLGAGYNREQALIAIGSGGFWGKGLGWGTQTHLRFLPLSKTDFIFAATAEELGLAGSLLLLISYMILFSRIFSWSSILSNNFAKLFAFGLGVKLVTETAINIGMNLGIFPIVGIALPFMSLGESHLLADFWGLGILYSMIKYRV